MSVESLKKEEADQEKPSTSKYIRTTPIKLQMFN